MRSCSSLKISDDVMTERCTRKLPPSTSSITSSDRSIGQPFAVRARAYRGAGAPTNAKLLPIDNQGYHWAEALYLPATSLRPILAPQDRLRGRAPQCRARSAAKIWGVTISAVRKYGGGTGE